MNVTVRETETIFSIRLKTVISDPIEEIYASHSIQLTAAEQPLRLTVGSFWLAGDAQSGRAKKCGPFLVQLPGQRAYRRPRVGNARFSRSECNDSSGRFRSEIASNYSSFRMFRGRVACLSYVTGYEYNCSVAHASQPLSNLILGKLYRP